MLKHNIFRLGLFFLLFQLYNADIATNPISTYVKRGETGYLSCVFTVSATGCYWLKNSSPIEISSRYSYTGQLESGDCSIQISSSDLDLDDGVWECGMPQTSDHSAIKSEQANYTVLVIPEDPTLWRSDSSSPIANASYLYIDNYQYAPNITCEVVNANPVPLMKFVVGYSNKTLDGNISITDGTIAKTYTSRLVASISDVGSWILNNDILVCAVNHPSYTIEYPIHRAYVHLGKPTQPTNIIATANGFAPGATVEVAAGTPVPLTCTATSHDPYQCQWESRSSDKVNWDEGGFPLNVCNTTFNALPAELRCIAYTNDKSNASASNTITISTESSSAQTGTIVAIVVVCVVLVVLMAAGVFGLYKKKMLCFKVSETNNYARENRPPSVVRPESKDATKDSEQAESLIEGNGDNTKTTDSEEPKQIIYTEVQMQPPKNKQPEQDKTQYASIRPYGIQ